MSRFGCHLFVERALPAADAVWCQLPNTSRLVGLCRRGLQLTHAVVPNGLRRTLLWPLLLKG